MSVLLVCAASPALSQVTLVDAFPNLTFPLPTDIQSAGDGSHRLFVAEKAGVISVVPNTPSASAKGTFLDITDRVDAGDAEKGLLGLEFHPAFPDSPYVYVNYTAAGPQRTVISRFTVSEVYPDSALAASERVILEVAQPFPQHNAGQLAFGPDELLYIGLGDGGDAGDPLENAQDLTVLLGKMLRIDVDSTAAPLAYSIPTGNPWAENTQGYREEIYALGFRNPWRYSFDPVTGDLWLGDVGQDLYEEIDLVTAGANYGWDIVEGDSCYEPPSGCDTTGLTFPVWVYPHGQGHRSVTGGYVYRGAVLPALYGRYIYGDYTAGTVYALDYDGVTPASTELLIDTSKLISTFGVDESGELLVGSLIENKVFRIVPAATAVDDAPPPGPARLMQNTPNPFNPRTRIGFELSRATRVRLEIYDVAGRSVRTLVDARLPAGTHAAWWDGRDDGGVAAASGIYFYRLVAGGRTVAARKMVLIR